MRRLLTHIVVYAAMSGFFVALWLVTMGSLDALRSISSDPTRAIEHHFWPIWPILGWGLAVALHAAFAIPNMLTRGRRRRRAVAKHAVRGARQMAKEAVSAMDAVHERRMRGPRARPASPAGPERRWVTVMFCDIADSTSHNERLGDDEWHRVLAHLRGVIRAALTQRGGSEVGTSGDGMLSRFESPADAVLCAIDVQGELGQAREKSDFVPEVRIGVHAGEAVEDEGDLVGRVINLASRVTDEASPGEILVTEPVADQLVGKLELEDRGLRTLKGMQQPRHLLAVKYDERRV